MTYLRALNSVLILSVLAGTALAQGSQIFVLNKQSDTMSIVDAATLEVTRTVSVGEQPHELAILPGGDKAYVSNVGENTISVVDLKEGSETGKITTPDFSFPHGIAFTPDARIAVVTSERTQKIMIIDARNDEILRTIDTEELGTHMVVIDDTGRWAYFTNRESNTVSIMDLNDYRIVASIPAGEGAEGIALSPDGKQIWTGDRRGNTVTVIDTEARRVIQKLPAGGAPIRAAFSPDGTRVFVPNSTSSDVFVYDARFTRAPEDDRSWRQSRRRCFFCRRSICLCCVWRRRHGLRDRHGDARGFGESQCRARSRRNYLSISISRS